MKHLFVFPRPQLLLGPWLWPWFPPPTHGTGPQFVFTTLALQFVFAGPGLQFVFTSPSPQFVFTGPDPQFLLTDPAPTLCLLALAPNLYLPALAPTLCLPQICIYWLSPGSEFAYNDLVSLICIYWPWATICMHTGC